jgi:hypothetical protein
MARSTTIDVARRAAECYERTLKHQLEPTHLHRFVAVEPDSGDYFLGDTLSDAILAARMAHPDRISFALRIGHESAVHLGVCRTDRKLIVDYRHRELDLD